MRISPKPVCFKKKIKKFKLKVGRGGGGPKEREGGTGKEQQKQKSRDPLQAKSCFKKFSVMPPIFFIVLGLGY